MLSPSECQDTNKWMQMHANTCNNALDEAVRAVVAPTCVESFVSLCAWFKFLHQKKCLYLFIS